MQDLFCDDGGATNDFSWLVAVFKSKGAIEAIKRANLCELKTYYPFRRNKSGDLIPLWRNYLFIEFKQFITINLCRSTPNFIKILSIPDKKGINYPILVQRSAIYENMRLLQLGKFDDRRFMRKFYGRGALVTIISGDFFGRKVELLDDIPPNLHGNKKVLVNIAGWKASIEIFKLNL